MDPTVENILKEKWRVCLEVMKNSTHAAASLAFDAYIFARVSAQAAQVASTVIDHAMDIINAHVQEDIAGSHGVLLKKADDAILFSQCANVQSECDIESLKNIEAISNRLGDVASKAKIIFSESVGAVAAATRAIKASSNTAPAALQSALDSSTSGPHSSSYMMDTFQNEMMVSIDDLKGKVWRTMMMVSYSSVETSKLSSLAATVASEVAEDVGSSTMAGYSNYSNAAALIYKLVDRAEYADSTVVTASNCIKHAVKETIVGEAEIVTAAKTAATIALNASNIALEAAVSPFAKNEAVIAHRRAEKAINLASAIEAATSCPDTIAAPADAPACLSDIPLLLAVNAQDAASGSRAVHVDFARKCLDIAISAGVWDEHFSEAVQLLSRAELARHTGAGSVQTAKQLALLAYKAKDKLC